MKRATQGFIVLLAICLTLPAWAAGAKQNEADKAGKVTDQAQVVADRAMAQDLIEYGRAEKNPLALLLAAQIIKANPAQPAAQQKATEGKAEAKGQKQGKIASADDVLKEAKALAGGNAQLVALIDAEAKVKAATRGAVNGPNEHLDRIYPGNIDTYEVTFRADELAEVVVIGDGDNDLDLYIYDENGNLIDQDIDDTDACYVSWTPVWTGKFKIKIKNRGANVYSDYVILTN